LKKPAPSRQHSSVEAASEPALLDVAMIAILLTLAMFMMGRAGFRRGLELMPWPDGLEYAATAVNIDRGLGPVLHFGGYSYPSRYTEGYPLILAAAYPLFGHRVERLCLATMMTGLLTIIALYLLVFRMFGRMSACAACILLALSPVFITYSTLVLSDVPTLTLTIFAALAFYEAWDSHSSIVAAAVCGLLAGFTVMIRPTNAAILFGIIATMLIVRSRPSIKMTIAFAVAFAIFPLWQAWTNARILGSPFASGYVFWVPEVYGAMGKTFSARFLFGPTMPGNPWGNVISYVLTLSGLDGMLGDPGDPRYLMYPFAAAAFAIVGIISAMRIRSASTLRTLWFGLSFLAALLAVYLFYFFTEIAFILPAAFILFAAAGYGIVVGNRAMLEARKLTRKTPRDNVIIAGVMALDLILAFSLLAETSSRIAATPQESKVVGTLRAVQAELPPDAIVVSNVSLQFLELYLAKPKTELIGLNAFDPGERFTDYHLARLYAKKASGWSGPVPPVLFASQHIDDAEAKSLADTIRSGRSAYLLMAAPEHPDYGDLLKDELAQLSTPFNLEPSARSETIEVYRITPR
jgi:hypothetical protein